MNFECRVCGERSFELVLDLGNQPWCNHFLKKEELGKEPFYPLHLLYCTGCGTVQLDYTVSKEIMFGDHTYLSGITKSLSEHFRNIAIESDARFCHDKKIKRVLDIGSNDGTQLEHFKNLGFEILGVESSNTTAKLANEKGLTTLSCFFNLERAKEIKERFNIINAAGVFFHLEELHSVADGIEHLLSKDGVLVVQFLYMAQIVRNCAFDQIYHEHLLYYNLETLSKLLKRHNLEIFDAYLAPIHGGSMIAFISRSGDRKASGRLEELVVAEKSNRSNELSTYREFAKRVENMKEENLSFLYKQKNAGKKIFGFGAPVKGNTMLNYFKISTETIDCLVEKNILRKGLYSPGMHIPIRIESELTELPDIYYVLAWNFKNEILANNQKLIEKGIHFYFPVNP